MISFERLDLDAVPWGEIDAFADRTIYQTRPWLEFVAETQDAEPVVAEVLDGGDRVGYFTGLVVRKLGLRILGSPFKGWTTAYQGFNLPPGTNRRDFLCALPDLAFRELGCHYVEVCDRHAESADGAARGYAVEHFRGYEIDLTQTEEELFARMKGACRRCIRKAAKVGVRIEEADDEGFADDYYEQLLDVFAKQSLVPTYDLARIRALVRNVHHSGNLLLLRARNEENECIATGIFPAYNDTMYFFGGASWRKHQILRPNEALMWHAMKYWKARGIARYDMGGSGDYKRKYGGYDISVPRFMLPRYPMLMTLRNLAERAWKIRQSLAGRGRGASG